MVGSNRFGADDGRAAATLDGRRGYKLRVLAEAYVVWRPWGLDMYSDAEMVLCVRRP